MRKFFLMTALMFAAGALSAATVVNVDVTGVQKTSVDIQVSNLAFKKCLARNLELSGLFSLANSGAVKVTGGVGSVMAEGRGHVVSVNADFTDEKSARMAARRLADKMTEAYGNQKGFAQDRVLFLNRGQQKARGQAIPAELCLGYPDGMDIRNVTSDGKMIIFPRWIGQSDDVLYLSDKNGATQIWQLNTSTGVRSVKWSFNKGAPTGIAVSPDGRKVAAILSFQGNPELYVIDIASGNWQRLTNTEHDVEGQPTWSPDGKQIAFVRGVNSQQIWVIDVATKRERRLTSRGRKNLDPDWGKDGRIAYISGSFVAVMDATKGDSSSENVTEAARWEHPSWSRDGRHLTASRDKAIFIIDTNKDGDEPRQMFRASGNWTAPSWTK